MWLADCLPVVVEDLVWWVCGHCEHDCWFDFWAFHVLLTSRETSSLHVVQPEKLFSYEICVFVLFNHISPWYIIKFTPNIHPGNWTWIQWYSKHLFEKLYLLSKYGYLGCPYWIFRAGGSFSSNCGRLHRKIPRKKFDAGSPHDPGLLETFKDIGQKCWILTLLIIMMPHSKMLTIDILALKSITVTHFFQYAIYSKFPIKSNKKNRD